LLAIHAKRHTYVPSRSFGAWVGAIARYKWLDRVRDMSRYAVLSLDDDLPVEEHEGAAISAVTLDDLLSRLKPAQESVIRLVKLKGLSVVHASRATGQSGSLAKVNIHRGLKKLGGSDFIAAPAGHRGARNVCAFEPFEASKQPLIRQDHVSRNDPENSRPERIRSGCVDFQIASN